MWAPEEPARSRESSLWRPPAQVGLFPCRLWPARLGVDASIGSTHNFSQPLRFNNGLPDIAGDSEAVPALPTASASKKESFPEKDGRPNEPKCLSIRIELGGASV